MSRRLFYLLLGMGLVLALWGGVLRIAAQEGTETYITDDRLTSFSYPAGWQVVEDMEWGTLFIFNTPDTIWDYRDVVGTMPSEEIMLRLTPPNKMDQAIFQGEPPITDLRELVLLFNNAPNNPPEVQMVTIGGKRAARMQIQRWNCGNIFWAFEAAPGANAVLELCTAPGEEEQAEHYGEMLIASLEFSGPPTAQTSDLPPGVVWQYVEEVDEEHDALKFTDLTVGQDGRIYMVDRSYGRVFVFGPEGTFELLTEIFGSLEAIAPMPDGTVWLFRSGSVLQRTELGTIRDFAYVYFDDLYGNDFALYGVHMVVDPRTETLYVAGMTLGLDQPGEIYVYAVSPQGEVLGEYKIGEVSYQGFIGNVYITFGPDGNLYIAASGNPDGVVVMTTEGEIVRTGQLSFVTGMGSLCGFAVQEDGSMIVAPCRVGRIWHFTPENTFAGIQGQNILEIWPTTTPLPNQGPTAAPVYTGEQFSVVFVTTTPLPTDIFANKPDPTILYDVQGLGLLPNGDVVYVDVRPGWWQVVRSEVAGG